MPSSTPMTEGPATVGMSTSKAEAAVAGGAQGVAVWRAWNTNVGNHGSPTTNPAAKASPTQPGGDGQRHQSAGATGHRLAVPAADPEHRDGRHQQVEGPVVGVQHGRRHDR